MLIYLLHFLFAIFSYNLSILSFKVNSTFFLTIFIVGVKQLLSIVKPSKNIKTYLAFSNPLKAASRANLSKSLTNKSILLLKFLKHLHIFFYQEQQ